MIATGAPARKPRRHYGKRTAAGQPRRKRVSVEHQEQAAMFAEFLARGAPGVVFVAIPNGEKRAMSVAKRLKAEGVQAGFLDLIGLSPAPKCPACGRGHIYFHEHKKAGGRLSPDQRSFIRRLRALGFPCEVSFGKAQGLDIMTRHGIILRGESDDGNTRQVQPRLQGCRDIRGGALH